MICGVPLLDRKIAPKKNCNPKESPKGVNFIKSHENHPAVLEKGDESSWRGEIDEIIVFSVYDLLGLFHVSLNIFKVSIMHAFM